MDDKKQKEEFEKALAAEYGDVPAQPAAPEPQSPAEEPDQPAAPESQETPEEESKPDVPPEADSSEEGDNIDLNEEFNKLHPKIKEAIEKDRQAMHSAVGRVAFLNREIDLLKNKQKNSQSVPASQQPPPEKRLQLEKLEALKKTDPEYATAVEEALEELDRRHVEEAGKWRQQVVPLEQYTKELELRLEETQMDIYAPEWREIVNSSDFVAWTNYRLPPDERQALGSYTRAKDLLPYINGFKQDWMAYQASVKSQDTGQSLPQAGTTQADKVAQDRARKLQQQSVGPTNPPKSNARPLDLNDPEVQRREFERVSAALYRD